MSKPRPNDISVGENKWIVFVDVSGRQQEAVELDEVIEPISKFLGLLETGCVAQCCGIDAFRFWPEDIVRAATVLGAAELHGRIVAIHNQIEAVPTEVFVSHRLNSYLHKAVLLELFDHLAEHTDGRY